MVKIRFAIGVVSMIIIIYIVSMQFDLQHLKIQNYQQNISFNEKTFSQCLILTSHEQLQQYLLSPKQNMSIIFIGDPNDSPVINKNVHIIYLTSQKQVELGFRSQNPTMIAYLLAIKHGARFIYEYNSGMSFDYLSRTDIQHMAFRRQRSLFVNIYPTFTGNFTFVSPGLPKEELENITQDGWSSIRRVDHYQETVDPLIQQKIIINYHKKSSFVNHPPVAVEPFTFTPFTDENIVYLYDAFWGLVLSDSNSNIWRSWWVQRLMWDIGGNIVFLSSEHEIDNKTNIGFKENVKEDENIGKLVRFLNQWKSTKGTLRERMEQLMTDLTKQQFCDKNYMKAVLNWIYDLNSVHYVFPSIKNTENEKASSLKSRRHRTAVCMTGIIECIEQAWRPTARAIRSHIGGEMDVFMYLSSTEPIIDQLSTVSLHSRIIEALRYENFTVKVLFENIPTLDPHFPPNCTSNESVNQPPHKIPRYYQQLFGLSNCFALVRDYEKKHNIKYEIMVRSRADIEFLRIPSTFDRHPPYDINTTMIIPPNRYSSVVDDGFAVGPIDALEVYMNRYFSFQECLTRDLHPERYLFFYLNHRKVKVTVDRDTLVGHIPHSPQHCH